MWRRNFSRAAGFCKEDARMSTEMNTVTNTEMNIEIEFKDIKKVYGEKVVMEHFSLQVRKG